MANISIEEAKANAWIADVMTEIDDVEGLLKKVSKVLQETAGNDDSIMQGIYKVGTAMEETWINTCKVLRDTSEDVKNAIKVIVSKGKEVVDDVETLRGKINRGM